MSRLDLLTVFIVAICLGALGFLVYKTVKLMNPPQQADTSISDSYDLDDNAYNWENQPDSLTETAPAGEEPAATDNRTGAEEAGYTPDEPAPEKPAPARPAERREEEPKRVVSTPAASASAGEYLVLAGTFSQRSNADSQAKKLRDMGYDDASVEVFDRGAYAVVMVARFATLRQAGDLVDELKKKGVDAYVKKGVD
jgi:cell division septation protein DedD